MRYLAVHAHLYQPPRENPWTEIIHRQPSAAPFHDWNARVSDECYERYGAAGVRGPDGRILSLVNLFSRVSFNIGPTLAAWLESERPAVLSDARAGDAAAAQRSGVGSAMMQAYGHPILPLCDEREKRLQVAWGKADFVRRYRREPLGIWLPEAAVDTETLEVCADFGLRYTILAPEQIAQVRRLKGGPWSSVTESTVPTHRPYRINLPSGRHFTVFVFHGPLSRGIAFGGALSNGDRLLETLRGALHNLPEEPGLVLMAADGETFGHHQRHAEEVLAEALVRCRISGLARVAHPGELLEKLAPRHEARLAEPSSWSCAHGVGRWSRACSCRMADHDPPWSWHWREGLRSAVRTLRDRVFTLVEREGPELFRDPWAAAERYGEVLVAPPTLEHVAELLDSELRPGLEEPARRRAAMMLELLRQTLFSATSCGWFFDDVAGIEASQVLRHAARASELCREVFDVDPEPNLLAKLAETKANDPAFEDGAAVYRERALTARHEPAVALGAHALDRLATVLSGATELAPTSSNFGLFAVDELGAVHAERSEGGLMLVSGRGRVQHLRTGESWEGEFEARSPAPGVPVELLVGGEAIASRCPTLREKQLAIGAGRAASLLPALSLDQVRQLAWATREAQELGERLPSPFPEAIAGGARALLSGCLAAPPHKTRDELRDLSLALEALEATGIQREKIEDLRPPLASRLARLAEWVLLRGDEDDTAALGALLPLAAERLGDAVLARVRRTLVAHDDPGLSAPRERLAEAAGLSPDALRPLEKRARTQRNRSGEEDLDALA